MKKIYAPWRSQYVQEEARSKNENASHDECVFCEQFSDTKDEQYFILHRGQHCAIILNFYPYNAGHLMVLPLGHVGTLEDLGADGRAELMELTSRSIEVLKKELKPHGFNTGMNLGKAAGAGIPAHLHQHIVPRFAGDTNFMPIVAEVKPISFDLPKLYEQLKKHF